MRNMSMLTITLVTILSSACSQKKNNFEYTNQYTLESRGIFNLELDSLSGDDATNLYVYEQSDVEYLVKGNFNNWRFDIYNLESEKIHKTISFSKEGPNGVGKRPYGFYFHNLDSIFLFFNLSQRICLINSQGELINKIGPLNAERQAPLADITNQRYPFLKDSKLYLSTYAHLHYNNQQSGMIIDLVSKSANIPYKIPNLYNKGYWSGAIYDVYYHDYNAKEDLIIQSYGADHYIHVIDNAGKKQSYPAKGDKLKKKMVPFSDSKQDFMSVAQHLYKFEAIQGGYGQIRYDRYREVYYRFVFNPTSASEFHNPSQIWDNPSIVILNKEFAKIGEYHLPTDYKFFFAFISKEGLNFFNKTQYELNEEILPFTTFRLVENEN